MSVFNKDTVEQVYSNSLGFSYSVHMCRKFDDGSVGKRVRIKENEPLLRFMLDFYFAAEHFL